MSKQDAIIEQAKDERLKHSSLATRLMRRPELGAAMGVILVIIFFFVMANPVMFELSGIMNFMAPAAQLGILAIGAALLMVGGEFDLSVGSMVAFAGLIFAACVVTFGLPLPVAILTTLLFAAAMGFANGQIVIHTGLPSFIVTLAFLFILRGLSLVGLKWATGGATQLRGVREAAQDSAVGEIVFELFSGEAFEGLFAWLAANDWISKFPNGQPKVTGIPVEILWFAVLAVLAAYVLTRTRYGNWIFASGGDPEAARNSGVPVHRVKTSLFMITAACAALVAILTVLDSGSTDARRGFQKEFEAIIAAVIGGCLLTGGYGSVIGAALGAIIFGMVLIGLTYTTIDQDWYLVFLGGMLLMAVFFNNIIRKRVTGER
ncbi:simple sugar transport system permease protein [Mesorhizobium sp. J18]|uniref:ABC transporter permease n=1 Tax=Mesorhizobium sp. J18 TaxID=935263 RepID=UPI00119BA3E9|nr:ABC transporter permease [Mesorhizobium sp. J18]TWG98258.1 simple sugar transport system permease protein [Mesorhizobium sp. J18]